VQSGDCDPADIVYFPNFSQRELVSEMERRTGNKLKLRVAGKMMLRLLGLFNPFMREMVEMNYLMTDPLIMDDSALQQLDWTDPQNVVCGRHPADACRSGEYACAGRRSVRIAMNTFTSSAVARLIPVRLSARPWWLRGAP
jgi:hypothetical protein